MPTLVSTPGVSSASPLAVGSLSARRTRRDAIQGIPAALASDWIKLTSVRSTAIILALNAIAGFLTSWAMAKLVTDEVLYVSDVPFYWSGGSAIIAAICGVLLFTSEVQHGTLAITLAAQPTRWVVAISKSVSAAGFGLARGATGLVAGFAGGVIAGLDMGDTSAMMITGAWALLYTTVSAVLGLGLGLIVRHGSAGIAGLLIWGLVIENLLRAFLPASIARFLPFSAGDRLLAIDSGLSSPEILALALSRSQAALLFGAYTALAIIIGVVLLHRRDAD